MSFTYLMDDLCQNDFFGSDRDCIGFKFSELEVSEHFNLTHPRKCMTSISEISTKAGLSVLLSNFTFNLTIVWNVANVKYPAVGKESNDPKMPLEVGLLKRI
ncbi:hypothetical protein AcV5_008533 [Taiwanofungus camphoratus]|nr:hypothetical protein AcV5_008533 [Antrodia cinnamomea]